MPQGAWLPSASALIRYLLRRMDRAGRNANLRCVNGRTPVLTLREWVIEIAVIVAIGIVLAALGPFGSFTLGSFADRLLYWIPAALLGYTMSVRLPWWHL